MPVRSLGFSLVAVSLFGLGCFRVGPRVAQAPVSLPAEVAEHALAYVSLNGGAATVTRDGQKAPAEEGLELSDGDRVTVTTGTISLIYPDSGASLLDAGTDLVILPHGGSSTSTSSVGAQIELLAGNIWTRFERLLGPDERFSVSSNNVVATVRGTAFGVSADPDGIDVQVADHQVDVTTQTTDESGASQSSIVRLVAGEGLKATSALFVPSESGALKRMIRRLSVQETARRGYLFAIRKLEMQSLRAPERPVRLKIPPRIPTEYAPRVQILRNAFLREIRFAVPTRLPIMLEQAPASSTPSVSGPTP